MPVRANAACTSSAALALALLLAVSACGGDDRPSPRLQPEMVESLAGAEAYDSGSNVAIFCDALGFREESRTWLVECHQEKKTSWVVDDQTKDVRQADAENGGTFDGSRLLTSHRDRLSMCVESSGMSPDAAEVAESDGKAAIEGAMSELAATHPSWAKKDLSDPPPIVDIGCPIGPALYDPDGGPQGGDLFSVLGRTVSEASPYRVHVYLLPEDEISRFVGESGYRVTTEELMWRDVDVLSPVTTGVYLSPTDLRDTTLVRESLDDAIGLESDQ